MYWAYSSQKVVVDLAKAPKLFIEVADVAANDDGFGIKLDLEDGKRIAITPTDLTADGKYSFDLTKEYTVEGGTDKVTLSGISIFTLNLISMDYNGDLSTMIVKDLYIADKEKEVVIPGGDDDNGDDDNGGEEKPAAGWFPDLSAGNLANWAATASGAKWTNMTDENALIKASAYGKYGIKLNIQKDKLAATDDPWQFLAQKLTLDLDKTPYIFIDVESLQAGDSLAFKVAKQGDEGNQQVVKEFTAAGTLKFDLRELLGKGEQSFSLYIIPVDANKDGSEFTIKSVYISDKEVSDKPVTGEAAPAAVVAVLAVSCLAVLVCAKKRHS